MLYKIELKTLPENAPSRVTLGPKELKTFLDKRYSYENDEAIVIGHDSLYDFLYDTANTGYDKVDSLGVVGTIRETMIEDDKLFLTVKLNEGVEISDRVILFYRSTIKSIPLKYGGTWDIEIIAVDLINIRPSDNVDDDKLSTIEKLY